MRLQASFTLLVLPLAGVLTLTGCPDPDESWYSGSCYCDDQGCYDYDGRECDGSYTSGSSGAWGGATSSSGWSGSSSGQISSGASGSSSGDVDGGGSSSSSSGDTDGGSSGASGGSSGASGGSSGTTSSSSGDIDAGPAPNCATDDQCNANQTCDNGFCRFECTSDEQCKLFDSRLDVCSGGLCRTE